MTSPPKVETFVSSTLAPPGKGDTTLTPEEKDELARRQSYTYGKYYVVAGVVSFVGYILTFALRSARRVWFDQPHYVHGCFGLMWGFILIHQIVTGATRGEHRRFSHRIVGGYLAPVVFGMLMLTGTVVVCLGLSGAGNYYGGIVDGHNAVQAYILLHMAAFDTFAFVMAYLSAKRKDFQMHKEMVGFIVMAFGDAGLYRLIVVTLHILAPCGHETISKNKKTIAHVINRAILLAIVVPAFHKYKRFTRLNLAMLAFFAIAEIPVLARMNADFCVPDAY